jgi:hypothetical protein
MAQQNTEGFDGDQAAVSAWACKLRAVHRRPKADVGNDPLLHRKANAPGTAIRGAL